MNLHKIELIVYKKKLESVALTNQESIEESGHLGVTLIPISQMDTYSKEAELYSNEVKNIYEKFLNKDVKEAVSYCKKNKLRYSKVKG